jgi:hypothetical protein
VRGEEGIEKAHNIGMDYARGGGEEGIGKAHNIGMDCARGGGNRKGRTRNGQNAEWPTTVAVLISSRDL